MGTMNAEMVIEDIMIAVESGRCPRCMAALQVRESHDEVLLECPACPWRGGFGQS